MNKHENLKMRTPDIAAENFAKLAELFPNAVTETIDADGKVVRAIDPDILQQEINANVLSSKEERYQFTWPDKRKSILNANAPIAAALRPCREESVDFDTTENLYIEGDNLDVLKLLRETYLNRVKMIYIDPPYNTGNDFIYEDDFKMRSDEFSMINADYDKDGNRMVKNLDSNGRFHTDWLNMMYPRLRIARDLLRDDGVIFISIDDNEVENLKKICNEIFGEDTFIECVIWKSKYGAGAKTVGFISAHEYILCYSKYPISNVTCDFEGVEREKYSKRDEKYETRGPYRTQPLMTNSLADRPNLMYSIEYNGTTIIPNKQWVWSKERMLKAIENNDVEFSLQSDGKYSIRSKSYLYDEDGIVRRGKPVSVLNGPFTQDGTKEVRALFDDNIIFDFSKPSKLIEYFLKLEINDSADKNFIILDFFSGSATTAHAVMQLNAEDGGNRKFIMVQLPEVCAEDSEATKAGYKNICELGKERIRRAGRKIELSTESLELSNGSLEGLELSTESLELSKENLEFRAENLELKKEMKEYGCRELSKDDCLAKSNGSDGDNLFSLQKDAADGAIRATGSNETSGSVNSVEYSRGTSADFNEGVCQLPIDSEGITSGVGNTTATMRETGIPCRYGYFGSDGDFGGDKQNVSCPYKKTTNCPLSSKFSSLNSKLSALSSKKTDIGFRVLKLDSSNMKDVYYTPEKITQLSNLDGFMDNIKPDRTAEDLLFQIMLELGIPLSAKITQDNEIWNVNDGYLIACFGEVDTDLITEIAKKKPYYAVFRDSSFNNDSDMVNFEQVFVTYSPTTIRRVL